MRRIILLVLLVFMITGCSGKNGSKEAEQLNLEPKVGAAATDFLYRDMDEKPFRLSGKKGSVVLLYFWRMKCEDCKDAMKSLEELHLKYKDNGLIVAAVGADTMHSSPINDVREFLSRNKFTFIAMRDDEGFVSEAFGVIQAPVAYVIDKNGVIAAIVKGKTDWMSAENTKLIESLLK
ncbi:MAG: TlpA family protein disulfide reductase [Deltaproteobacteria bacterium]|nr:TlpA family protein disulfide reductase [Deltaproteobacteria bacterium]